MKPTLLSRLVKRGLLGWFFGTGWKVVGTKPSSLKAVLLGAPHTKNFDFIVFLGGIEGMGLQPAYIGKHSLFRWPMARFMRDMGGVPIRREGKQNLVEAVIAEFARRDTLHLVIAPEGTRAPVTHWKTGFWHIADGAGVPIVPAYVDYDRKIVGMGPEIASSGDYARDLRRIADFYRAHLPNDPKLQSLYRETGIL